MNKQIAPQQAQSSSPAMPPYYASSDDEIDLKELFLALWQGKIWIIACTLVFAIAAVVYALTAQEWWSSKAKIMEPQLYDFTEYQQQVMQFQPIFDVYQDDGTVLISEALYTLVEPESLFQQFVSAYNSSNNKKQFLDNSEEFQSFKQGLDTDTDTDATRALYAQWFNKISAVAENKNTDTPYNISLQATTKQSSYMLLNDYISSVKSIVFNDALNNLQAMVNSKRNELQQQKRVFEVQAKNHLAVEIERTQYALTIAKAASVERPLQGNRAQELFSIDLGSQALAAKITALKSITNLNVIEPKLQQIDAKLEMLSSMTVDRNIQFQTFKYLENVEEPITRDKPKRASIAVLGTLLGGMLGVAFVLVRFVFRKEEL